MRDDDTLLVLDMHAVNGLLGMEQVSEAVAEAFLLHSREQGRVFPVIRERLHTGGVFGIKAGDVASQDLLGYKAAGFWPGNRQAGGEPHPARSEERRVGKGCVRTCRSGGSPDH